MTPPNPPARSAPTSAEESLRLQGTELATLISAVIRIGRAYSVTNQVFRTQLSNIATALRPVLELSGEAVFVVLDSDLYLNGARVPVSTTSFRFHQTVIDAFKSRGISGIRVERAVNADDLGKFFNLFLQPNCPHGGAMLKACADLDLSRILPAIHASTDPTAVDSGAGDWAGGSAANPDAKPWQTGEPAPEHSLRKRYAMAYGAARSLLTTTSLSGNLEMRHAKRVIQPLVDGAYSDEPIVVGLSSLHEHDEFTYSHAVNVCAIAVTMGHALGIDRRSLADIGVAALLHDVGKDAVNPEIVHPLEAFTAKERAAAERHPVEGAKLIASSTTMNQTTLRSVRAALEHHVHARGRVGYPDFSPGWNPSLISQIVALADCYVNLHARRGELVENITPYEALGMILGPYKDRFEPALVLALIQAVGFFPPGQFVELSNGATALVLAPNPKDPARPHVRLMGAGIVTAPGAKPVRELNPMPREMSVRRVIRGESGPRMVKGDPKQKPKRAA